MLVEANCRSIYDLSASIFMKIRLISDSEPIVAGLYSFRDFANSNNVLEILFEFVVDGRYVSYCIYFRIVRV